jgi:hypothetical protein
MGEIGHGTDSIGAWMEPTAGLGILVKSNIEPRLFTDERTGLYFTGTGVTGPCHCCHSRVQVPQNLRPYLTVLFRIGFAFCRLLRVAGLVWTFSKPLPHKDDRTLKALEDLIPSLNGSGAEEKALACEDHQEDANSFHGAGGRGPMRVLLSSRFGRPRSVQNCIAVSVRSSVDGLVLGAPCRQHPVWRESKRAERHWQVGLEKKHASW